MTVASKQFPVKSLVLIFAIILLSSCAGGGAVQISNQDLNTIGSVSIDPEIAQPEIPFIQGAGNFGAFLAGGGIGASIEQQSAGKIFKEYLDRNNIDISKIVYDEFKKVIIEDNILPIKEDSDVKLKLTINGYGFGKSSAFSLSDRRPMLNVTASLINKDSETVWSMKDYITNLNSSTDTYTYDQLAENPQLTEKSLKQVSTILARLMLSNLKH
jgi:hypothetical protein